MPGKTEFFAADSANSTLYPDEQHERKVLSTNERPLLPVKLRFSWHVVPLDVSFTARKQSNGKYDDKQGTYNAIALHFDRLC